MGDYAGPANPATCGGQGAYVWNYDPTLCALLPNATGIAHSPSDVLQHHDMLSLILCCVFVVVAGVIQIHARPTLIATHALMRTIAVGNIT